MPKPGGLASPDFEAGESNGAVRGTVAVYLGRQRRPKVPKSQMLQGLSIMANLHLCKFTIGAHFGSLVSCGEVVSMKKHRVIRFFTNPIAGVIGILGGFMSKKEKVKFTVYLDKDFLKKTDKAVHTSGCSSRNEFIIKAIENHIAEVTLSEANPVLTNKLAKVISQSNDVAMKKVASGLFRYAVYLDMTIQMIADCIEVDEDMLEEYRKRAYRNVRRTKGRISLDSTLHHTGISDED